MVTPSSYRISDSYLLILINKSYSSITTYLSLNCSYLNPIRVLHKTIRLRIPILFTILHTNSSTVQFFIVVFILHMYIIYIPIYMNDIEFPHSQTE